ncbi:MAG: hypothetical protein ACREBJ_06495 [Nitrosotalea sp.]
MKKTPRLIDSKSDEIKIDSNKAIAIARKFLEQYHSSIIFKSAYNDGKTWTVSMEVGLLDDDIMEVAVDVRTGKILGYSH